MRLTYPIVLRHSEEGVAVARLALPGRWSQGDTEEEPVEEIQIAIRKYSEAAQQFLKEKPNSIIEI